MVAALAFDASAWLLGALIAVFGFVSGLKSLVERMTLRFLRRRRQKRMQNVMPSFAAASALS
jgi:Flp pilus assembly protein TadB